MVIWCTQNVGRDDSPTHITVTQESSPYECFTSTETVRTIRDEVYTPAVHFLFNVCTETGVLIYRSVCPLSVQCVHRDGCVNSQVFPRSVQCENGDACVNSQVCPRSVQCVHRDGCVNSQVCMPALF